MPAICESISTKLSENLTASFKKTEKENFETHLTPTAKQVLSAKIEYEPVASYNNSILSSLQTKYIVLKPNQSALSSNGNTPKSQQSTTNGKNHSVTSSTSQTQLPQPKQTLFSRDQVQVGWGGMGRQWSTGCGFNNIGNTCYLNSALQAFFHVPALAHWLNSDKEHRDKCTSGGYQQHNCIICAMSLTLTYSQRNVHSMTPSLITNKLQSICRHLHIGRQEDAHEFLRYLIEQMEKSFLQRFKGHKELDQYSKETTALNQIIGGYLRSTVTCGACKHDSITFQHFMDLPLDISRVSSLNEALNGYFARENLEECGYKCESCKKKVSATKRFTLERAPVVLCIQLKRFNVMGGKLSKQIQISQNLELSKHLAKAAPQQNCSYKLVSMVTHLGGSASGGHYTAIGLAPNGNYYQFDDSCVSSISTDQVMRTNAYVLFYELVSRKHQNGVTVNHIHQNEHTYSKSASSSTSTSSSYNSSFAKPKLPPMIPASIMRQNNFLKQKENETTPPARNGNGPSTSKVTNGCSKVSTQLFPAVKTNGKREASSDDSDDDEVAAKRMKPSLPSLPRLTNEEHSVTPKLSLTPSTSSPSVIKPKSLVPYETDDEDDEPSPVTTNGVKKSEPVKLCRTSSGVFVETDLKESNLPSRQGATIDKTVVTKASQMNGAATNGKSSEFIDSFFDELSKQDHNGYGTSEVVSWNNTPSNMNREIEKDKNEERKREFDDDEDMEMDSGRVKKVKARVGYPPATKKLPNPFQVQQNGHNGNGSFRSPNKPYYENNGFKKYNGNYRGNNNNYRGGHNNHNHNNNHKYHKYNNGNGNKFNNKQHNRYFNRR